MSEALSNTLRLFKQRPSFIEGAGSLLDFYPLIERYNADKEDAADSNSLREDWIAVGKDMGYAINKFKEDTSKVIHA